MNICEKCPIHTRSTPNHTRCELYDAYAINNNYVFNMIKFDSARNWSLDELKDLKKTSNFFGPYQEPSGKTMFFFSLEKPSTFEIEKYEYEETDDSVEDGHIFALVSISPTENTPSSRKTHYRQIRNLGSHFESINFSNISQGGSELTIAYKDGDICDGDVRYSSQITIACDKSTKSLSQLVYDPKKSTSNKRFN